MRLRDALKSITVGALVAGTTCGAPVTINTALPVGGGEFGNDKHSIAGWRWRVRSARNGRGEPVGRRSGRRGS